MLPSQARSSKTSMDHKLRGPCCVCFQLSLHKLRRLQRPNAGGGRWEPDSFNPLLWGQNMLKRLDKDTSPSSVEAELPKAESSLPESAQDRAKSGQAAEALQHPEVDAIDPDVTAVLDRRRQEYRHLVHCGRDVTLDYPPPETPTWQEWQEAIQSSISASNTYEEWRQLLEEAVKAEDYATAAELKRDMDAISAKDVVDNFIQDYKLAIEEENFDKAGELLEGCSIDLCGWWSVTNPSTDNAHHILRISKAYDRYRFDAFTPAELAQMHGISSDLASDAASVAPTPEEYANKGVTVAELHFQRFPSAQEVSGERIYTLATAVAAPKPGKALSGALGLITADADAPEDMHAVLLPMLTALLAPMRTKDEGLKSRDENTSYDPSLSDPQDPQDSREEEPSVDASTDKEEDSEKDISESLHSTIQSLKESSAIAPKQRVPLNLLRTEKDRIMLVVAPSGEDVSVDLPEGMQASSRGDESGEDEATISGTGIIHVDGSTSAEEVISKLKALIKKQIRGRSDKPSLPATGNPSLFDEAEKNLERRMRDEDSPEGVYLSNQRKRKMLRHLSKHVKDVMRARHNQNISRSGLKGAVGYSRLEVPTSTTDPFSGLFIGLFGPHGPEVLQVQRVIGQDGKEYVEGVKVTGDANVPAGRLSFRAAVSSDSKMPSTRYLPPELGIRARYKGEGQVAEVGFKNPRWVDGELWHLSSNNALGQAAEIGFLYTMGENKILTPLQRIHLDDPLGALTR